MAISALPYLPRPDLEKELCGFLLAPLSPRANATKALLLTGEKGVGKRTLLQHCLANTPELQRYKVCPLDLRTPALQEPEERNHKLKEKGFDSAVEVLKEISPFALRLLLGVLHIFTKDEIFQASSGQSLGTLADLEDFFSQLARRQPLVLTIENFDHNNSEHLRGLALFVDLSYACAAAFVPVMILHEPVAEAQTALKNLLRFCRHYNYAPVRCVNVAPYAQQEYVAHFATHGLSAAWAETMHRFSEGYPDTLQSMWRNVQNEGFLQKEGARWVARDEPQHLPARDFLRKWLGRLTQRHQHETDLKFRAPMDDALLLAAAMGETFLPQAVAEAALPRKREYTPAEIAAWEDLWYEILEEPRAGLPAWAAPVQEQGANMTLTGAHQRRFFVYAFHDPQWQALLQRVAKQLCDPQRVDQPLYDSLMHLEEWLHACFQENWEQALPYRIAVNRALWQIDAAQALEKLQRLQKLRVDLPQQISAERKRVEMGAAAGGLYQLLRWYSEVMEERGEYPEALEAMYEAHTLVVQQKIQLTDLELATHLNELGRCYHYCGQSAEAELFFRRSLAIREEKLGPEHTAVALSLNNLAALLHAQDKYSEAEPLYRRSLTIREQQLGLAHPDIAQSLNNLAALLLAQGKYSEAEPLFRYNLAIREQQLGPEHPDVAVSLSNLAALLNAQGQSAAAESLFRRAFKIYEKQLGPDHPSVAKNLSWLAELSEEYEEAQRLYQRAIAIYEKSLGPEHPDTHNTQNKLLLAQMKTLLHKIKSLDEIFIAGNLQSPRTPEA